MLVFATWIWEECEARRLGVARGAWGRAHPCERKLRFECARRARGSKLDFRRSVVWGTYGERRGVWGVGVANDFIIAAAPNFTILEPLPRALDALQSSIEQRCTPSGPRTH